MSRDAANVAAAMLSEARRLVWSGWCQGMYARDPKGNDTSAWSGEAVAWSPLSALLASWHRRQSYGLDVAVLPPKTDAEALGAATQALGEAAGTASVQEWNDDPERSREHVIDAFDRALGLLDS